MRKFGKICVDLVASLGITSVLDTAFWQDLIITCIVILANAVIIPCLKSLTLSLFYHLKEKNMLKDDSFIKYLEEKEIVVDEQDVKTLIEFFKEYKKGKKNG